MKEELKTLNESVESVMLAKQLFSKHKMFFNMKVEEQKEKLNIQEVYYTNNDSYSAAIVLTYYYPEITGIVSAIREEHPKYGTKKIKELVVKELYARRNGSLHEDDANNIYPLIVDNYFLYDDCGFFKLQDYELAIKDLEKETKEASSAVLNESKKAVKKAGNTIVDIVKPYGEVAKSQLDDAGNVAKKAINKGSKKLVKFFENIEKKTSK